MTLLGDRRADKRPLGSRDNDTHTGVNNTLTATRTRQPTVGVQLHNNGERSGAGSTCGTLLRGGRTGTYAGERGTTTHTWVCTTNYQHIERDKGGRERENFGRRARR